MSSKQVDWSHTSKANQNREKKAKKLALAAMGLGYIPHEVKVKDSTHANERRRERARKAAGISSRPSDETWSRAVEILQALCFEATGGVTCAKCGSPVRRVRTAGGAGIEIDPFAHPMGTVWPRKHDDGSVIAVVLAGHDTPPSDETPLFRQHASSCAIGLRALERTLREAPKCRACGLALDAVLAYRYPAYHTHPGCYPED